MLAAREARWVARLRGSGHMLPVQFGVRRKYQTAERRDRGKGKDSSKKYGEIGCISLSWLRDGKLWGSGKGAVLLTWSASLLLLCQGYLCKPVLPISLV